MLKQTSHGDSMAPWRKRKWITASSELYSAGIVVTSPNVKIRLYCKKCQNGFNVPFRLIQCSSKRVRGLNGTMAETKMDYGVIRTVLRRYRSDIAKCKNSFIL